MKQLLDSAAVINKKNFFSDLERLASREYMEEGIPMMLALEVVLDTPPSKARDHITGFAACFRYWSDILESAKPHACEDDLAVLLELLAERLIVAGPLMDRLNPFAQKPGCEDHTTSYVGFSKMSYSGEVWGMSARLNLGSEQ